MQYSKPRIYTISRLNRQVRQLLETELGQVWLRGELSNFVAARSGHWYFTLKDDFAQVRAAMFKNANQRIARPKEGDHVVVRANLSLYEARGDYQVIVEHLEPEGQGKLKQQFEQLKQRLQAEGWFAAERKQALPRSITKVGVVTSPTGAAFHDILSVMQRRNPSIEVILYPSQVQGETAVPQLVSAIQTAERRNEVDVLIVGRGGGSLEDLWCFNDERVAMAIANASLPVISAVGHEVDISIADFIADLRAPTPSAAAELVSDDKGERMRHLLHQRQRLQHAIGAALRQAKHDYQLAQQHLKQLHPEIQLQQQIQRLDGLSQRLSHYTTTNTEAQRQRLARQIERLALCSPQRQLPAQQRQLGTIQQRLTRAVQHRLTQSQRRFGEAAHLLDAVSPLATVARGYSISLMDETVIRSIKQVKQGERLTTRVQDGVIHSTITKVTAKSIRNADPK